MEEVVKQVVYTRGKVSRSHLRVLPTTKRAGEVGRQRASHSASFKKPFYVFILTENTVFRTCVRENYSDESFGFGIQKVLHA